MRTSSGTGVSAASAAALRRSSTSISAALRALRSGPANAACWRYGSSALDFLGADRGHGRRDRALRSDDACGGRQQLRAVGEALVVVERDDAPAEVDERDLAVLDAERPGTDLAMGDAGLREPIECRPAAREELVADLVGREASRAGDPMLAGR